MPKSFIWNFRGRRSTRLKGYDYSLEGCYFITICTSKKKWLFGNVIDGRMELSRFGFIARREWERVGRLRKDVALDSLIFMPNHAHMVIWIKTKSNDDPMSNEAQAVCRGDALRRPELGMNLHGVLSQ